MPISRGAHLSRIQAGVGGVGVRVKRGLLRTRRGFVVLSEVSLVRSSQRVSFSTSEQEKGRFLDCPEQSSDSFLSSLFFVLRPPRVSHLFFMCVMRVVTWQQECVWGLLQTLVWMFFVFYLVHTFVWTLLCLCRYGAPSCVATDAEWSHVWVISGFVILLDLPVLYTPRKTFFPKNTPGCVHCSPWSAASVLSKESLLGEEKKGVLIPVRL